jgi:dTDP-4-amino-4,6-dideoxygalactose transaminase
MTHYSVQALLIDQQKTIREAMLQMDQAARGVLLLVNEQNQLLRTITDGDLRRAALQDASLAGKLNALPHLNPICADQASDHTSILRMMDAHSIDHIPIVDMNQCPVDLVDRKESSIKTWLSTPHLGDEEMAFVDQAFKTNWIAPLGPHVDAFERDLASSVGLGHAAALSSGTAAIHLGLLLLGVKAGDTVFCSSLTFVGSTNPILYCGAQTVLIDSEPQTWNMSPIALEKAFVWAKREGRLPKCVLIVNLYGQSADMDALLPICEKYGVPILEDAAESLGATYKGQSSGSFGKLAVYSFNGNKIITTSGGGMLVSNDADMIARARKLSTQAREPAKHYEHKEVGFNYRMSNVLAGIGRGQLNVLSDRVRARRAVFDRYREAFAQDTAIEWMPEPQGFVSTRWLSCMSYRKDDMQSQAKALAVMAYLERHNVEARPVWKPMHLQPLFEHCPYFSHDENHDVSQQLYKSGICLPSGSNMTSESQTRVIGLLHEAISHYES